jgi:putative ABC transport system substrate-binding protein
MNKKIFVALLMSLAVGAVSSVQAQPHKPYRIGVIHEGGPYRVTVEGFKDGLRAAGLEPGKDVVLEVRDVQGNRQALAGAAKSLEQAKVDLLFSVSTSATIAAKGATREVPIVFAIGSDAVAEGFVESLARPGGRLTGVQRLSTDLTPKRLELLKDMLPDLHRVITFYDPGNSVALQAAKLERDAGRKLKIEIKERPVASVAELRQALDTLDPKDTDALMFTSDAMVTSQSSFVIDTAKIKKLPTMFAEPDLVSQGALAGYGAGFYEEGRLSATYVQRILAGKSPKDLPVESFTRYELWINLQTARALGITIPQSVLFRADKVIE